MQCCTQEQIAKVLGITQQTASNITAKFTKNGNSANIGKDFTQQLYNIWNFSKKEHLDPNEAVLTIRLM